MTLGSPAAPTLETPRLILRGWRPEDVAPYAAMLADAETAR
jgi:RimJ/RimL family protein N-acetyltransferase